MNKYEIIGIVGEGAYGIVYKAKCKETGEFGMCLFLSYTLVFSLSSADNLKKLHTDFDFDFLNCFLSHLSLLRLERLYGDHYQLRYSF